MKTQITVDIPDSCDIDRHQQCSRVGGPEHSMDYIDIRVHLKPKEPPCHALAAMVVQVASMSVEPGGDWWMTANSLAMKVLNTDRTPKR